MLLLTWRSTSQSRTATGVDNVVFSDEYWLRQLTVWRVRRVATSVAATTAATLDVDDVGVAQVHTMMMMVVLVLLLGNAW